VLEMIKGILKTDREFDFWQNDEEFYESGAVAPRSNCIMNSDKVINSGVELRPIKMALEDTLHQWKSKNLA